MIDFLNLSKLLYFDTVDFSDADSWFLEAHTPSMHEHYEGFYSEALREDLTSDTRTPPPCFNS